MIGDAAFFKGAAEKVRHIMFDTHGGKDNGEFFFGIISKRSLAYNLSSQLVMGKAVPRENRKFLTADQSGQTIDGGNSGTDIVPWIFSFDRI